MKKWEPLVIVSGLAVGAAAFLLMLFGNPANMGFCIACFERDIVGALGLHGAAKVQYLRPEIIGLVLGAFLTSLGAKEFRAKAGSSPATRFLLGMVVMVGALLFLGCPLRMVIRLAGGDLNALVGFAGFFVGILVGVFFLKKGFSLGRAYPAKNTEGGILPFFMFGLLLLAVFGAGVLKYSTEGPGSKHAALLLSLLLSLIVGALAQRSRLCMVGGLRDVVLFGDTKLLSGFGAIFVFLLIANLIGGKFSLGFQNQPVAHSAQLWNLIGMFLCGWGSVLLGGCPLRQLILAGEGNGDSAVSVLGMMAGAALSHTLSLAGNADSIGENGEYLVGGPGMNGKIAAAVCIVILLAISVLNLEKEEKS